MTQTIIIDADCLVYKASEAAQELFDIHTQEDDKAIYRVCGWGDKQAAIDIIEKKIDKILTQTKSTSVYIALSDAENNFRKKVLPTYKGQRKIVKPILYSFLREYFHKNYKTYERPYLEGDDILGILATSTEIIKGDKAVWSLDKDLSTIPCTYFKENQAGKITKVVITPAQADYNFMFQALMGDRTDGYLGCPNIGAVKAKKLLGNPGDLSLEEMWELVVFTYEKNGMTKTDALIQAQCARILRASDYDFKRKEVILWSMN